MKAIQLRASFARVNKSDTKGEAGTATNTYTMNGCDGELFLAVNGFVLVYAEKFIAKLTENLKEYRLRTQRLTMAENYTARIMLRRLSNPHPDVIQQIISDVSEGKPLDFEFKGFYTSKDGFNRPIRFSRLIPITGDLDDYLDGYVDEWEFSITFINDDTIDEFKKVYQ